MKPQSIALLVLIVLALFAPVSVWAQDGDATVEPTEEPAVIEVEAGESTEIDTPQDTTEIVVTTETETVTYYGMIIAFGAAVFGVLLGGGGVFAVLSRANKSVATKDSTEALLAQGVPQEYLDKANEVTMAMLSHVDTAVQGLKDALQFVASVTDRKPNDQAQG